MPERQRQTRLLWIAAGMTAIYGYFALRYPLPVYLATPRATWFVPDQGDWITAGIHFLALLALALLYKLALTTVTPERPGAGDAKAPSPRRLYAIVIGGWLLASFLLLFVTPGGESHDIYDYLYRGRLMALDGYSPLAVAPREGPRGAWYAYVAWKKNVDTYGPLWEYASAGTSLAVKAWLQLTGNWSSALPSCPQNPASCTQLTAYVTGYRLLAILLCGLCAWIMRQLLCERYPGWVLPALVFWLWNPLTLFATAVGAHNDLIMLALWLLCFWALQRRHWVAGLLLLLLAGHVKLTGLLPAPMIGLWLVRQIGWRRALACSAAATALALPISYLLYWPLGGWATLPRMLVERNYFVANSVWQALYWTLLTYAGWARESIRAMTITLPSLLFLGGGVWLSFWWFNWRPVRWRELLAGEGDPWPDTRLWRGVAALVLFYLAVGSFWYQPWYLLWLLAPAALTPIGRLARTVVPWLTFGALASNIVADAIIQQPGDVVPKLLEYILIVVMIWAPALFALALQQRQPRVF